MATIKNISDLSVGDWVEYEGLHYPITFVGYGEGGDGSLVNLIRPDLSCFICKIFDIHPIPITAEMLEKNGFARGQRGSFYHYLRLDKNRTLYIHASTNGWRVEITYDAAGILRTTHLMPDMNSVHQLQHVLRLAGVDKEINL